MPLEVPQFDAELFCLVAKHALWGFSSAFAVLPCVDSESQSSEAHWEAARSQVEIFIQ